MSDFLQTGSLLTLPMLDDDAGRLRSDLEAWSLQRPLALLLPCHARDLSSPALSQIIETIAGIPWVSCVAIGLDEADEEHRRIAKVKFNRIGQDCAVVYYDKNEVTPGKGRNIRDTARVLVERPDIFAVAIHDCDIRTYSRDFLARLCWPVLHPDAGIMVCKGYYARTAAALHGRVFRLFFQPLLRAWGDVFPDQKFPAFLRAFRYPLAGEICLARELLARQTFDPGWGFEVQMLHNLYRLAPDAICQAELCAAYEHKHQAPGALVVMAEEILATFLAIVREEGHSLTPAKGKAVQRSCQVYMDRAQRDSVLMAQMHRFSHDEAGEREMAVQFAGVVRRIGD